MTKPRKKWEPVYRFGGNKNSFFLPVPLGEDQYRPRMKKPKKAKRR